MTKAKQGTVENKKKKLIDLSEIIPCQCKEGSKDSTMVEHYLNGTVFHVMCCECDESYDCNFVGDVVEEWNKIQQAKIKAAMVKKIDEKSKEHEQNKA